ncbi:MAG: hypothetical protein SFV81_16920, partial [Pirellulaceae bacterium]|nr:hypothetical protein [Pirellulaceae bacterium]
LSPQSQLNVSTALITSLVYFPPGNHETQLKDMDVSRRQNGFQHYFQGGQDWYSSPWLSPGYFNNYSGGGSGERFDGSYELQVGDSDSSTCQAVFGFTGPLTSDSVPGRVQSDSSRSKGLSIHSKSTCAMLAIELALDPRHVLNVIAKDQDGARLVVHPMQHGFANLATYGIETLPTTKTIRFYGCADKLEYVEMFIKPPTVGLDVLNDPNEHARFRIVAQENGWSVVEENRHNAPRRKTN